MSEEFTIKKLVLFIAIMLILLCFTGYIISDVIRDMTGTNIRLGSGDIKEAVILYSSDIDSELWKETDDYDVYCLTVSELIDSDVIEDNVSFKDGVTKDDLVMVRRNKSSFEIEEIMITEKGDNNYKMCKEMFPKTKYTITFHKGDNVSSIGDSSSDTITKECTTVDENGCTIVVPSIKANTGYSVIGWNSDKNATSGSVSQDTEIVVNSDMDYYAITKINKVSIKYNVNGGFIVNSFNGAGNWRVDTSGNVMLNDSYLFTYIDYGKSLRNSGLEDNNDSNRLSIGRDGYKIAKGNEWRCLSGCTGTYSQSKVYSAKDFCDVSLGDCDIVLGVNWVRTNYTIKYSANGGNGQPDTQHKDIGSYVYISDVIPTRSGYSFMYWNTKEDGSGVTYYSGDFYNENESITLYAQWSKNSNTSYSVKYSANGGSGEPSSQTKLHDVNLTLSSVIPSRSGYTFIGWNTNSSGTGTNYSAGSIYSGNASITLYAKWSKNNASSYNVSYIGNGGSNSPSMQTKYYGVALTLSTSVPTRSGYLFKCWNTKQDGSGTCYNPGGIYTDNKAVVLYAQWSMIPSIVTYTITYNANGGSGAPGSQTKTKDVPISISSVVPFKNNYTFMGWSTSANSSSVIYIPRQQYNGNTNLKLYAVWKSNSEITVESHTHDYKAVGNTLRTISSTKLSCGHDHTIVLYRYCSICGRASYLVSQSNMYACPCTSYSIVYDDSVVGGFSTYKSWLGGVVSGYYKLDRVNYTVKNCSEH